MNYRLFLITTVAALNAFVTANGHQSPVHAVQDLTERIEAEGPTARLLVARAYERQSLRNWEAAVVDFKAALELNPRSRVAMNGCAQSLMRLGDFSQAELMAQKGIALDGDVTGQAPFCAILATIYAHQKRWVEALDYWGLALKIPQPEIDWFLGEAEALKQLSRYAEQVKALSNARQRNPSVVLHRAWVRALVDAEEFETAFSEIETGINKSRWKSSWLLLRAQIHGQKQNYDEQRADASTALSEINSRLSPEHPDPYLVLDAARALAFMGQREKALE